MLSRRSIRDFSSEQVSPETLKKILEAGRNAPTATNVQPWHFIVIKDPKGKKACVFNGFNKFATKAAFIILGVYLKSKSIMETYSLMDVTVALQNMVIASWAQGIGSCWMGAFNEPILRRTLNLPEDARIVGGIAMGIPKKIPPSPPKKKIDEIVHIDIW
ncbi:nitroreductase family protein [Candidatus Lokiarchaeum ossiferum]|uniref:nitroreductase family protein n=1 Tax=Candidatus Lokiarchaeum ossiferum TaxID=2951803 RepID=UPI00352FBFAC